MNLFSEVSTAFPKETPVVRYLATRFTYFDYDKWLVRIAEGKIQCNGFAALAGDTVSPGDIVSYDAGEFEEPAADLSYRIAWEDPWFLCIDKPGNLLVHRAGISFHNNLTHLLRHVHVPAFPTAHPVHRLDRETSGALIVAKTLEVRIALGREFDAGRVEKWYYAIVHGIAPTGPIELPIGKLVDSSIPYKFGVIGTGKACRTNVIASEPLSGEYSLVTLKPLTGRTHQIRVHLAAIGHPVVGDKLYGQSEAGYLAWRDDKTHGADPLWFPRQALHCATLAFMHPYAKERCTVEVPMREDMQGLIETLRAGIAPLR
jgi:RluA family pseudouridine synthase